MQNWKELEESSSLSFEKNLTSLVVYKIEKKLKNRVVYKIENTLKSWVVYKLKRL